MSASFYKSKEDFRLFLEQTSKRFLQLVIALILLFFLIRVFEYFYISHLHNLPENSLRLTGGGFFYDVIFLLRFCGYVVIPFLLTSYFKPKIADVIFTSISLLLLPGNLLLIFYYSKSLVPLGADMFGYSFSEIMHTVQASGGINLLIFLSILVLIFLVTFLFNSIKKLPLTNVIVYFFYGILLVSFLGYRDFTPQSKKYQTDLEYYTVINKLQFFSGKAISYLMKEEEEVIEGDYFIDAGTDKQKTFSYVDNNFPFERIDSSMNVLGNFFNSSNEVPNFIFIITESLGRSYSGEEAIDGSFTPFLDSLARKSLYWKNFLSTSGRTFAVFSSLFASLPFGEKGFLNLGENMPKFISLITILKQIGYKASFFHGGDVHFDNMDIFFNRQNVDYILGDKNFGSGYKKMPPNAEKFSWGYGDKELFKRSLEILDQQKKTPRIDIYLTLSMHDPFLVEGQEFYKQKVRALIQTMPLSLQQKAGYEKYVDMYATAMYTDDAFKEFFSAYSKRNEFKNTIFIITGDHQMPEIPIKSKIDRFHVPFLIYSPLLKRSGIFSSISTHFDVLPSLVALLRENYKVKTSKYVSWIGGGLDTATYFRNIHSAALMRNKNELLDYLERQYFLADQDVFEVFDNLFISKINDEAVRNRLQNCFDEFKVKNKTMLQSDKLLPDSVLSFIINRKK